MKKLIVFLVLTAGLVSAATKTELKDSLVATGDYLYVSDPILTISPFDSGVAKYTIVLLIESPTDTLVAYTTQQYLWVLDDEGPGEQARYNRNNLVNPPAAIPNFRDSVQLWMADRGINGEIVNTWISGDVETAKVIRSILQTDTTHIVEQTAWITRTSGVGWMKKIVD